MDCAFPAQSSTQETTLDMPLSTSTRYRNNHSQNSVNETVVRVQLIREAPIHVEKNDRLRHGHGSIASLGFS